MTSWKRVGQGILLGLIGMCSQACVILGGSRTLEAKDTRLLKLVQTGEALELKGVSGHSALGVRKVDVSREQARLHVSVELVLAHEGITGNFDIVVDLHNVDIVDFGDEHAVVWRRKLE